MKTLWILHEAFGQFIKKGYVRLDAEHADLFEEMISPIACYEISSDGCRFTLTEDDEG